ncbi:MAG: YjiG family protein [Sutterellaceae bacterium]|nr:YjiG family protein [Sutterellaceae bacterium]MDD7442079.1 YjiG family protein [Sutterellaceae bacterium]MDY2867921.1 YjiG family protein [Mesosutterella sp.]
MAEEKKAAAPKAEKKEMITDVFVRGARQGWGIAINSMIPNVLMAFVIIKILKVTGLLDMIGAACGPVMAIFGLPGEAIMVLLGGWLSMGGGVGVAVAVYESGALTGTDLAILAPAIFLMGSQVQYLGRCLGVIGVEGKMIPVIMAVPIIVAVISLWVMRLIVLAA